MQDFEVSKIWEKAAMHIHRAFADHLSSCDSIFLQLVDQNCVSPHLFHIPKILLLCHSPAFLFPSIALLKMFQKRCPDNCSKAMDGTCCIASLHSYSIYCCICWKGIPALPYRMVLCVAIAKVQCYYYMAAQNTVILEHKDRPTTSWLQIFT